MKLMFLWQKIVFNYFQMVRHTLNPGIEWVQACTC